MLSYSRLQYYKGLIFLPFASDPFSSSSFSISLDLAIDRTILYTITYYIITGIQDITDPKTYEGLNEKNCGPTRRQSRVFGGKDVPEGGLPFMVAFTYVSTSHRGNKIVVMISSEEEGRRI